MVSGYLLFLVELKAALTEVIRTCEAVCHNWAFIHSTFTEYCSVLGVLFWRRSLVDTQQLNEVVNSKVGLKGIDTLMGNLVNLLALRASELLLGACLCLLGQFL